MTMMMTMTMMTVMMMTRLSDVEMRDSQQQLTHICVQRSISSPRISLEQKQATAVANGFSPIPQELAETCIYVWPL